MLLAAIHDPPPQLYVRGAARWPRCSQSPRSRSWARVRAPSYGRSVTRSLARELAAAGLVVVSGMARGIDGEAHRGALEGGGRPSPSSAAGSTATTRPRTPSSRAGSARTGLVVSEYEPGVEPAPWRFPARNRIIAGLCSATVVVEARERSGALITADFALEEGRDVLAVPGEITSALSAGTNALLRLGATPVTCAADVLELYGIEPQAARRRTLDPIAAALMAHLRDAALTADELVRASGLDPGEGAAALMELELAGQVMLEDGVYRAAV